MFKSKKLSFKETILLLFQVVYGVEYEKAFKKALDLALKHNIVCYKITFTNNDKLQIDNKIEELTFMKLNDLVNNYFIHNNIFVKKYARVNFNSNCLVRVEKHYDITYYYVYVFSLKGVNDIRTLYNLTSFKYKFNFNKKERKLVYKLKNCYLKGYKYSYNFSYMQDIQESIENIKQELESIKQELLFYDDMYKLNKESFFKEQEDYISLLEEKQELENKLEYLQELESNLISSKEKPTTLEDYYKQVNLEDKKSKF